MPTLVYLHGFLSSPESIKAVQTRNWLTQFRPDWDFQCPFISSYPSQALPQLESLFEELSPQSEPIYLLGSSLGGFWATVFAERYSLKAVLVNPSVRPALRLKELVGEPIKNYHTGESYTLSVDDGQTLESCQPQKIVDPLKYWLLAQQDDEVLDFREACDFYRGCKQMIEEGGNHSFEGFEDWIEPIVQFFELQK